MSKKNEVATVAKAGAVLPSLIGASQELQERMHEVKDNLESVEGFRIPRVKATSEGFELVEGEPPIKELEGVLIHTKKTKVYYEKPFRRGEKQPPDCYSLDGVLPDKSLPNPVNPTCKGCPMDAFGTNAMKKGKACRDTKPMYFLLGDEAIIPRQLSVTPSSLRAANQYLMDLTERGIAYRKVVTKVIAYKDNPADTFVKLKFIMGRKLDPQQVSNAEYLKNQWLGVMNNQMVDQQDVDSETASTVQAQPTESHVGF